MVQKFYNEFCCLLMVPILHFDTLLVQNGFAALHGAAREGHQEAVNVLLQGWADVNMQSKVK